MIIIIILLVVVRNTVTVIIQIKFGPLIHFLVRALFCSASKLGQIYLKKQPTKSLQKSGIRPTLSKTFWRHEDTEKERVTKKEFLCKNTTPV